MKLTGTNRPITYTTHPSRERIQKTFTPAERYKETRLLASTMWFPTNKPVACEPTQRNNNTTVVTPDFPPPGARSKGYGGHSVGETPGPIPNPEAKTHSADGTAPGRVWESRSPPEHHYTVESPNHPVGALPHLTPHTKPPT